MEEFTDKELNFLLSLVFQRHMELLQDEVPQVVPSRLWQPATADRREQSRSIFGKLWAEKARRAQTDLGDTPGNEHVCSGAPADCVICNPILGPEG